MGVHRFTRFVLIALVAACIVAAGVDGRKGKGGKGNNKVTQDDDTKSMPREVYLIHRSNNRAMGPLPPMPAPPQRLGDYIVDAAPLSNATTVVVPVDPTVLLTPASILQTMAASRPIPAKVVAVILEAIPKESVNVTIAYPNGDAILTPVDQKKANDAAAIIMTIDPVKVAFPHSVPPILTPAMILATMAAGNPLPQRVVTELMRHIPQRSVNIMVVSKRGDAIITPTTQSNANDAAAIIVKIDPTLVAEPAIPAPILAQQIRRVQIASAQYAAQQAAKKAEAYKKAGYPMEAPAVGQVVLNPVDATKAAMAAAAANSALVHLTSLAQNASIAAANSTSDKQLAAAAAAANAAVKTATVHAATATTIMNAAQDAANARAAVQHAAQYAAAAQAATIASPLDTTKATAAKAAQDALVVANDYAAKLQAVPAANFPTNPMPSVLPTLDPFTQATLAAFDRPTNSPLASALRQQWEAIRPSVINAASNSGDPALRDLAQRAYNEAVTSGLIHPPAAAVHQAATLGVSVTPVIAPPPTPSNVAPITLPVAPIPVTSLNPILMPSHPVVPPPLWPVPVTPPEPVPAAAAVVVPAVAAPAPAVAAVTLPRFAAMTKIKGLKNKIEALE